MKTIKVKELSKSAFAKYGEYYDFLEPESTYIGESPIEFYRDAMLVSLGNQSMPSFSVCRNSPRERIIDTSEYHSFTHEFNLPMDGDVLMHVAPASPDDEVPVDEIEVFRIPKGTGVRINAGVWHHAPFVLGDNPVLVLVLLPERTYKNDGTVVNIPGENQLFVEWNNK